MKLLLDTNVLIWMMTAPDGLTWSAREAIANPQSELFASAASAWELAVLQSCGKARFEGPVSTWFTEHLAPFRTRVLPVQLRYIDMLVGLPLHHRDPFDRMLVATAMADGLTIVTSDRTIPSYDVPVLW